MQISSTPSHFLKERNPICPLFHRRHHRRHHYPAGPMSSFLIVGDVELPPWKSQIVRGQKWDKVQQKNGQTARAWTVFQAGYSDKASSLLLSKLHWTVSINTCAEWMESASYSQRPHYLRAQMIFHNNVTSCAPAAGKANTQISTYWCMKIGETLNNTGF